MAKAGKRHELTFKLNSKGKRALTTSRVFAVPRP
jgi:hypothetical protein